MKFDTTLFENNDQQLAMQVKALAKYFKVNDTIRISWIDAKYLVKRSFSIIHELSLFNEIGLYAEHEDKNYYNYYLMLAMKSFRVWNYYKVVRSANVFLDRIPRLRMKRIKNERNAIINKER